MADLLDDSVWPALPVITFAAPQVGGDAVMEHPSADLETVLVRLDGCDGSFHESECGRVCAPGQSSLPVSSAGDDDAWFLFLWIGFNAAHADEDEVQNAAAPERDTFKEFFQKVVALDAEQRIYDATWDNFSGPIRALLHNEFVFTPFWKHHNGVAGFEGWEEWLRTSERRFRRALGERDTVRVLRLVFDRLCVLRNQIVHGGATWDGRVNRDQDRDGAAILAFLMPVFVDAMMDSPHKDWGHPFYPVVELRRAAVEIAVGHAGACLPAARSAGPSRRTDSWR